MTGKALTERQTKFIDLLLNGSSPENAKDNAGYSKNTTLLEVIRPIADEILEASRDRLVVHAPQAVMTLVGALSNYSPTAKDKRAFAESVLDRVGLGKSETINMQGDVKAGIFFLPAKELNKKDETASEQESSA